MDDLYLAPPTLVYRARHTSTAYIERCRSSLVVNGCTAVFTETVRTVCSFAHYHFLSAGGTVTLMSLCGRGGSVCRRLSVDYYYKVSSFITRRLITDGSWLVAYHATPRHEACLSVAGARVCVCVPGWQRWPAAAVASLPVNHYFTCPTAARPAGQPAPRTALPVVRCCAAVDLFH